MKRLLVVFTVVLTVVLPFTVGAEPVTSPKAGRDGSIERDKSQQGELAAQYLKTLFSNIGILPKPQPMKFAFNYTWVDAQPEAKGDEQWRCLSEALYFEARGETVKGQFAVAEVIMNRVSSSSFPGTLCGVIKQGTGRKYQCQFTYNCDGYKDIIAEHQAFRRVSKVARAALDEAEGVGGLTDGATYYHSTAVRPAWARRFKQTARIGVHLFYRPHYRTAQND